MATEEARPLSDDEPTPQNAERPATGRGARLASAVVFVHDLVSSVDFYGELLGMHVTLRTNAAALLVNAHGSQLYLRMMGPDAAHALGSVGVQFVIWTADGPEDLRRCERLLKSRSAHVNTQTGDGFTLVEGRDPNQLPVVVTYPGPDQAPRHEILPRIYTW